MNLNIYEDINSLSMLKLLHFGQCDFNMAFFFFAWLVLNFIDFLLWLHWLVALCKCQVHTIIWHLHTLQHAHLATTGLLSTCHHTLDLLCPFLPRLPFSSGVHQRVVCFYKFAFVFLWLLICFVFIFCIWVKSNSICLSPSDLFDFA